MFKAQSQTDDSLSCYSDTSSWWRYKHCDTVLGYLSCYTRYQPQTLNILTDVTQYKSHFLEQKNISSFYTLNYPHHYLLPSLSLTPFFAFHDFLLYATLNPDLEFGVGRVHPVITAGYKYSTFGFCSSCGMR